MNKIKLNNQAQSIRKRLGVDESSPIDLFSLAQTIDSLTLVLYPLSDNISGVCFKNHFSSLITINSNHSQGRQRFSLAHELYHLFFDEGNYSKICSTNFHINDEIEKEANQFASYLLMPPHALSEKIQTIKKHQSRFLTLNEIIKLEQYFGISHQAMLNRLIDDGEITANLASKYQRNIKHTASLMGYDTTLYTPTPKESNKKVLGYYITQADRLFQNDIISNGKYEEYLLDAFREDLVFGETVEGGDIFD